MVSQLKIRDKLVQRRKDARYKLWSRTKSICSAESWQRVVTSPQYAEALDNMEEISGARLLWNIICETHIVADTNLEDDEVNFAIKNELESIKMLENIRLPTNAEQALRFMRGLHSSYNNWKRQRRELGIAHPESLTAAYVAASKVRPLKTERRAGGGKGGMAFATTSDAKPETNKKGCYACNSTEHVMAECPVLKLANEMSKKGLIDAEEMVTYRKSNPTAQVSESKISRVEKQEAGRKPQQSGRGRGNHQSGRNNTCKVAAETNTYEYDEEYFETYDDDYYDEEENYEYSGEEEGSAYLAHALAVSANSDSLGNNDILCDNQANLHVFHNRELLDNIQQANRPMPYGGQTSADRIMLTEHGSFMGIPGVWIDPNGKANILSYWKTKNWLKDKKRGYIEETDKDWTMSLDNNKFYFNMKMNGLHACDVSKIMNNMVAVSTVQEQMGKYSQRDIKRARQAKELIDSFNAIDEEKLKRMLNASMIKNCDLIGKDVNAAMDIYGKSVKSLKKAKSRNNKVEHIPFKTNEVEIMTPSIAHADIMDWRGKRFLVSVIKPLDYTWVKCIKSEKTIQHWRYILMHHLELTLTERGRQVWR